MNALIDQFKKYGNLTLELEAELKSKIKFLKKQKGDFLLKSGQVISNLFVIEKGLVRSFYQSNEKRNKCLVWF